MSQKLGDIETESRHIRTEERQPMRYIGSKTAALTQICEAIDAASFGYESLCDPFAGTCTVSQFFKSRGMRTVTGDLLELSYVFQRTLLYLNRAPSFSKLLRLGEFLGPPKKGSGACTVINHLNKLPAKVGYFSVNYSPRKSNHRMFFTVYNAGRIDATRQKIREWRNNQLINRNEECYLLACLIDAADRVANTAGTYYAFLKSFYRKALLPLQLRPVRISNNSQQNDVARTEAATLVEQTETDILYLDPPYNGRNYAAYYHLPETLVRNDSPQISGKSGIRTTGMLPRSAFCSSNAARTALEKIIGLANCRCVVVHYAVDGLVSHRHILEALRNRGPTTWSYCKTRRYSAQKLRINNSINTRLYVCRIH